MTREHADFIGIRVPRTTPAAKCAGALRKLLPLSISEIRRRIAEEEYLYLGSFTDLEEVDLALSLCKALACAGIEADCFEHTEYFDRDRPFSREDLESWSRTCHDIEAE